MTIKLKLDLSDENDGFHVRITINNEVTVTPRHIANGGSINVGGGIEGIILEINKYVKETFSDRVTGITRLHYIFNNKNDRTMFLLRWSNE